MNILQLAQQALEDDKRATPGPWESEPDGSNHRGHVKVNENSDRGFETIAHVYCGAFDGHGYPNAEFIAAARTREPLLAAEVIRLHTASDGYDNDVTWRDRYKDVEQQNYVLIEERDALKSENELLKRQVSLLAAKLAGDDE